MAEDMALEAVKNGVCDVIDLGRPLLADPDYCNKLRAGRVGQIRPCISCQEGCMGRVAEYSLLNCAVNPQAARERVTAYEPILAAKKVMIIGGGVAGCEAARVLAIRGHRPKLYEAGGRLGGNLIPGCAPEFKADDIALALGASGVRIAPIPDKISVVGIEVPNKTVSPVLIRDVIESRSFMEHRSAVAFAVGRDIGNKDIVVWLTGYGFCR